MTETTGSTDRTADSSLDSYELKIDEQVNNFLELNHKLTFFSITAAVGTLAFTLNFAVSNKLLPAASWWSLALIASAAITALLSSVSALAALRADIASFRLHLRYRYERRTFDQLQRSEKVRWDRINRVATKGRSASFWLLVATVALQLLFLLMGVGWKTADAPKSLGGTICITTARTLPRFLY